jgi:DNA-binding transcriptional MerR regulator
MTPNRTRFHIGRLARETGRSVHTIRWYEKQGLMPGVTRDPGGRRVYVTQHIGWLLFLDRLRYAGMTVREMRRYASLAARAVRRLRKLLSADADLTATQPERMSTQKVATEVAPIP